MRSWYNHEVVIVRGLHDTRQSPYDVMTLAEIELQASVLGPSTLPKQNANAMIPSSYHDHDARSAAAQREHGQFCAVVFDLDKGNHSLHSVQNAFLGMVGEDVACWGHTTSSATPEDLRWRVIIPLAELAGFEDWHDMSLVLHRRLADQGLIADPSLLRANQISFLPNVPPERCDNAGHAYCFESFSQDGDGLPWAAVADDVAALREELTTLDHRKSDLAKGIGGHRRTGRGVSVIEAFNSAHDMASLLLDYGYEQSPRSQIDWRSPMQTSGTYATRIVTGEDGREIFISLSGSDAEACLGAEAANKCRFGDAFDLLVHFEHAGNFSAALKAAEKWHDANEGVPAGPVPMDDFATKQLPMPAPFPGTMEQVYAAALAVAAKPQPAYALLAALIGMASACHGHYALPSGGRLNLYGLGVGETGTGKDMPQVIVKELAREADVRVYGEAGSGQGLEDHLVEYKGSLMVIDEISHTLAATLAKNAPPHLKSAEAMYLKLFSSSRSNYTTRLLTNSTQRISGRTIKHPCLSLIGFATPEGLADALGEGAITSGLLGRMLMAKADIEVKLRRPKENFQLPQSVIDSAWNIKNSGIAIFDTDAVCKVTIPQDVDARLEALLAEFDAEMRNAPTEGERALLMRSFEKVERIAGVLAVWDNPTAPEISHGMVDWAVEFVRASDGALLSFVREHMHGTQLGANAARIVKTMKQVLLGHYQTDRANEMKAIAKGYAPRSFVMRKRKEIDKPAFDLAVDQLVAQGDIIVTRLGKLSVLAFPTDDG